MEHESIVDWLIKAGSRRGACRGCDNGDRLALFFRVVAVSLDGFLAYVLVKT